MLDCGPRSSRVLPMLLLSVWLSCFFPAVLGLRTTSGSPCADACGKTGTVSNTTSAEISCLDSDYSDTDTGSDFEKCIACQLGSKHRDSSSGETDVNWGLYNLRFAFTTCVFDFPRQVTNTTSPCPVACEDIRPAAEYDVVNPNIDSLNNWCSQPSFADNVVNTCTFCYNLTSNQIYLANFLESIRYNCHFKTTSGSAFDISPSRIFTQTLLPSSMSLTTPGAKPKVNLGVVIALPILGFIIILVAVGTCCFFFIRHRRRKVRQNRMTNHLYARWNDTTMGTPKQANGGWPEHDVYSAGGYGAGAGFGFVDNDGRGQQVGYGYDYSKNGVSEQIQPAGVQPHAISTPGLDYDKKGPL